MDHWLLEEREKLLRLGVRAFINAALVTVAILVVLVIALWIVAGALGVGDDTLSTLLMITVVAVPILAYLIADWMRRRFWVRAIGDHVRRLRAVQFVSNYADAVGEHRIRELPAWAKQQVEPVLKRERQGMLPQEKDYALAIQPLLLLEPKGTAERPSRSSGENMHRHRHRKSHDT
ncbi:hypothetical protein [Aquisalimonas sp.]|uniref:hypothetical protein n=1 Tax=Aquisalimonas sp. TaxID=1872621 RepID=UPI0025C3B529|nr:hypothetical protein [Aquisalimonas sp.]